MRVQGKLVEDVTIGKHSSKYKVENEEVHLVPM